MSFERATRQNIRKIAVLPYESKQRKSKDLPRTGLLANLFLRVEGTLTVTLNGGTAVLKADQYNKPYGLIDRFSLKTNNSTSIVDVTGHGLFLRNLMDDNQFLDILASSMVEAQTDNPTYQFATSAGANPVAFTLKVPVVTNDRDLIGLILLQNGETLVTANIDWADVSNLFTLTGGATVDFTGNAHMTMEYFDVPAQKADYPNLSLVHTLLEDTIAIDGTGTTDYQIPRGNIYQRLYHRILLNGAPAAATDIEQLWLQYNQSISPYAIESKDFLAMQRIKYKRDLPKGVYVWDFSYQGQAGYGSHRDLVNSAEITDFLSRIDVASAATLGTNNNKIFTLKEQLMPLV